MSGAELTRRLAAILAADAEGYSRAMACDEQATVAALDAARAVFRARVEANRGRIVDTAGDSVLAVLPSAAGAVLAALAIQEDLRIGTDEVPAGQQLRFRIGVHLGDVVEKADGTVYGDGVNIAARLQALAEPGGVTVSDAVRGAARARVTATFEDRGQQAVKNIAEPLHTFAVRAEGAVPTSAQARPRAAADPIDLSLPDKPSIAVLPFANMSGDPEQEYFCDGITEDIITELSRYRTLFVIARNSSFSYRDNGTSPDVRQVGKDLGVRYVLEGSIRRSGGRIRVTAQLIDALAGTHLWAERYDRVLEDIFDLQEELTRGIAAAIAPHILLAETDSVRRLRPHNLRSYDLGLRAWANATDVMRSTDADMWDKSIAEARHVVAVDPRNTTALKIIAMMQWLYVFLMPGDMSDAKSRLQEGLAAASKVVELDPLDGGGHARVAILLVQVGRPLEALTSARQAHDLNPGDANALLFLSGVEIAAGQPQQGLDHAQQASRLSPRDPYIYFAHCNCATASFFLRDHARGLDYALRAIAAAPNFVAGHFNHCLLAVGVGDIVVAKAALSEVRRLAPKLAERVISHPSSAYHRLEDRERVMLAFRIAAGLEDPAAAEALR